MATPSLALAALHVPFGASPGLVALSLIVAPGERLALLGPSGEGKTSLLRAIAGLAPTQGGRVLVGGRDVTALPAEQRGAVYLHQVPVLFTHLDVRENVAFPLAVRGVSRAERHRAVQPLLERLGLAAFADRRPDALSGGQRHRVALARALAARPQVLLLDEPLAALDPALRADVRAAIAEAHAAGDAALVLVTHDLDDAAALGDRVAVLLDRRLAQVAPPATLFARPASRAVLRFLGQHQELPGTVVSADRADTPLGVLPITPHGLPSGARVHVGVRTAALESVPPDDPATDGVEGEVTALCHRPQGTEALVQVAGVTLVVPVDAAFAVHARVRIRARVRSGPFPAFAD